jgi:aryl-alcohol dehydrogenase-like predicted oxidoreductase
MISLERRLRLVKIRKCHPPVDTVQHATMPREKAIAIFADAGITYADIGEIYGLSPRRIAAIVRATRRASEATA